jgi:hypothetical protein
MVQQQQQAMEWICVIFEKIELDKNTSLNLKSSKAVPELAPIF